MKLLLFLASQNSSGGSGGGGTSVYISNCSIDENGDLIVTLSDGTVMNAGKCKGEDGVDGKDGKSLTWNDLPEVEKHNLKGENGAGVNVGGTKGQVLTKASDIDFDTYWQDLTIAKKSYNGVIAPNAYKEIVTGIPARNIIIDIKVKDTAPNSETSGFYINAQNLSTVAITDNRIRIFNEYSTNLEFLITTLVLNDSEIIAI